MSPVSSMTTRVLVMAAGYVYSILTLGLSSGIPQCIVLNGQIAGQTARGAEQKCVH